ncbi:hypothetical protein BYT27DRAFT_7213408 [Phlegmacium glaucopus]|nr:hypothetical protein BYT27DRAFT_7213408 [Phlegmacium glaucopus]
MTSHQPTVTAYKQPRRSKKGNLSLREDDDDTIDTVTHEEIEIHTSRGLVTKRVKIAHWPACPLHRIERWTSTHFRRAALWEVQKDNGEQDVWHPGGCTGSGSAPANSGLPSVADSWDDVQMLDVDEENRGIHSAQNETTGDDLFLHYLESLRQKQTEGDVLDEFNEDYENMDGDDDDVGQDADDDMAGLPAYLPPMPGADDSADYADDVPQADALNNVHVRIVHTNGIHYLINGGLSMPRQPYPSYGFDCQSITASQLCPNLDSFLSTGP